MGPTDKDIDQLFKKKLTDLNLNFDPKNWSKLEKKLKKKKRRRFFWLFFLTGIFIAGGTTYTAFKLKNTENISAKIAQITPLLSDDLVSSEFQNIEKTTVNHSNRNTLVPKIDSTKASHQKNWSSVKKSTLKEKSSLMRKNSKVSNKKNGLFYKSSFSNPESLKTKESQKFLSKNNEQKKAKKDKRDNTTELKRLQLKSFELLLDEPSINFSPLQISTTQSSLRKFALGVEIYPNVNYIFNSPSSLSGKRKINEEYGKSVNFGMNFTYFNTEKIDFNVGVNYSKYSHSVWFLKNKIPQGNIAPTSPSDSSILVEENNEFHFVKIQFDFNYYLSRNKWSPYLSITPALNFNLKSKSEIIYEDLITQNNAESKLLSPSINIGFGLNHSVSKDWNLYLQSNFEFHLTPTTYSTLKKLATPFSVGIKVGLRKKWQRE